MKEKKCLICWNKFITKYFNQKYCWYICAKKSYDIKRKEIYSKKTDWILHKHKCEYCKKEFLNKRRKSKYCNRICFEKDQKIKRKWKNNPSYRNWIYIKKKWNNLIHNWKYRFAKKQAYDIKKEMYDKNWVLYCEHCFTQNSFRFECHHLIFRSEKPKHKELHNKKNLIILCIKCHNLFHKNKWIRFKYIKIRELNKLFEDETLITRYS